MDKGELRQKLQGLGELTNGERVQLREFIFGSVGLKLLRELILQSDTKIEQLLLVNLVDDSKRLEAVQKQTEARCYERVVDEILSLTEIEEQNDDPDTNSTDNK